MDVKMEENIEKKILRVAERFFLEKGFSATSTTEIAKEVGCNQALIHYYYRTKEKLFWDVFTPKMEVITESLAAPLADDMNFLDRIRVIIDYYFSFLELNHRIPVLFVNELIMVPERWELFRKRYLRNERMKGAFDKFEGIVNAAIESGEIRKVDATDLFLNVLSLIVSAFVVSPMGFAVGECDSKSRMAYLDHRKEDIKCMVVHSLKA